MQTYGYVVVGGGIVGVSTAMHLTRRFDDARVLLVEKEASPEQHQTGRNSGVIQSGIYYKPGSFKAIFAKSGSRSMVAFYEEHGTPHDDCGKVVVVISEDQLPLLENLYQREIHNEVPLEKASPGRVREIEPHVKGVAGVLVKSTGLTSILAVCRRMLKMILEAGGEARFGCRVTVIQDSGNHKVLENCDGGLETKFVINCAGLHNDRLPRMSATDTGARIVAFRCEHFELVPEKRHQVKTLVYPLPNPDFPFLGVHFTRMIDGSVHAGPNAVLAHKREGYLKSDFSLGDFAETMAFPGFWKLISKNLGKGLKKMHRPFVKSAFLRSLKQIIPEVRSEDLVPCKAGVRAQALFDDGRLVDDFLMNHKGSVRVARIAKEADVCRFIYMSSCSAYGVAGGDVPVTEETPVNPQTAYAACKTICERGILPLPDSGFSPLFFCNSTAFGAAPALRSGGQQSQRSSLDDQGDQDDQRRHAVAATCPRRGHRQGHLQSARAAVDAIHGQILNIGSKEQNYRVREVAEIVAEYFPGCTTTFGSQGEDNRSYRVSFDKLYKHLPGFSCDRDIASGACSSTNYSNRSTSAQRTPNSDLAPG